MSEIPKLQNQNQDRNLVHLSIWTVIQSFVWNFSYFWIILFWIRFVIKQNNRKMYILEKLSSSRIRLFLSKYTEGIGMNDPPSLFDLGCRDMAVTCWRRSDGRRRKWTQDHPACNEQKHKTFIRRQLFSLFFYYVPIPILGTLFRKEARSYLLSHGKSWKRKRYPFLCQLIWKNLILFFTFPNGYVLPFQVLQWYMKSPHKYWPC